MSWKYTTRALQEDGPCGWGNSPRGRGGGGGGEGTPNTKGGGGLLGDSTYERDGDARRLA